MRLKTGVIHSLFVVLSQGLDGYDVVVNGEKVRRLFELGSIRLDIAVNANKLKPIVQGFEEAHNALIAELSGGKSEIRQADNPAAFAKYQSELKAMANAEHEVDLKPLSKAALKLETNPIAVQSLMILQESGLLSD